MQSPIRDQLLEITLLIGLRATQGQNGRLVCFDLPTADISGTDEWYGASMNCGGLSLMSWTLMMNSDGGSKGSSVSALMTWAVSVYSAFSSRSSLFMAWMSPVNSLMAKMVPAPSPARMYLMLFPPTSKSVCNCRKR